MKSASDAERKVIGREIVIKRRMTMIDAISAENSAIGREIVNPEWTQKSKRNCSRKWAINAIDAEKMDIGREIVISQEMIIKEDDVKITSD